MAESDDLKAILRDKMAQLRDLCATRSPKKCGHGVSKSTDMNLLRDIEALETEISGLERRIKGREA